MFPNGVNATKKRTASAPGFALSMAQHEFLHLQVRDASGPWNVFWFDSPRFWDEHILTLREQAAAMDEPPLPWD